MSIASSYDLGDLAHPNNPFVDWEARSPEPIPSPSRPQLRSMVYDENGEWVDDVEEDE